MFVSDSATHTSSLSKFINFGNGKTRPNREGSIPVYGGNGILSFVDQANANNVVLIGRVGAYCGSVYLESGNCWVSDNAIWAKSKVSNDEYFDYFLLKRLNLYNHHVGTGQQLLTQQILNKLEIPTPNIESIKAFNRIGTEIFPQIEANRAEAQNLLELQSLILSRLAV